MEGDNLPAIKSHGAYTYTIGGFRINGQKREEGSQLRKLVLPQNDGRRQTSFWIRICLQPVSTLCH